MNKRQKKKFQDKKAKVWAQKIIEKRPKSKHYEKRGEIG